MKQPVFYLRDERVRDNLIDYIRKLPVNDALPLVVKFSEADRTLPKTTSSTLSVAIQRSNCNGLASHATSLHGKSCMSQAMPLPPVSLVKWCRVWKVSSAPSGKALRRWASVA